MLNKLTRRACGALIAAMLAAPGAAFAQTASLQGQVTDETGAVIPAATVTLTGPSGLVKTAATRYDGWYSFAGLAPGNYTVEASAPELSLPRPAKIALKSGVHTLHLQLKIASTKQQVAVEENGAPAVSADPASNASALVLRGDDLQALSDNPEDLQADLMALAGPSAGPNGGSIFIDGFSNGQLPSKESIREIRINQNPFAPEYDKLGYGRIEIFTKPGTDKYRGTLSYNFADSFWNSRDPFAERKAPFLLKEYGGNLSGPINRRASFLIDIQRHSIDNGAIVNAVTLDPETLGAVPFTDVVRSPQRRVIVSPRVDCQLSANHTLVLRYGLLRADIRDAGIGSFNLASRGVHVHGLEQHVQATETAVLGTRAVNETRFQFFHTGGSTVANSSSPAIQVLGAFNGGGAQVGRSFDTQNNFEFQNNTSLVRGAHAWRFGVRLRGQMVDNISPQNFGGTFTFAGGLGPDLAPISSIERYRRTLLHAPGGGATQFSVNAGIPAISASQVDMGAFVGDDWRARSNLTLSFGLRYETQTNLHDRRDFAPRLSLAWAPGAKGGKSRPKTVLRLGFGMFYDRFSLSNTLAAMRYNGTVQQQYVITNPDFFPEIPPLSALAGFQAVQTIREISATLRASYTVQSAAGFERQLPWNTTVAVTYANSHGLHMLRSEAIGAPGGSGPIFLMESAGLYNQNQLITNVNSRVNRNISLFGSYALNRAMSNTDGLGTFPANPRDFTGEYGPAATDIRHRMSLGGSVNTLWNVRLNPLVIIGSGPPFDITAGRDLYGNTLFNGRPGIATDPRKPGLIATSYGLVDPNPTADERILPRNYGRGPGSMLVGLRLGRTFGFGPSRETAAAAARGPGGGFNLGGEVQRPSPLSPTSRRYNLTISMSVRNLINHTNPGPIIGNITSPLFGKANQTAGAGSLGGTGFLENANNRRLELQTRFTF